MSGFIYIIATLNSDELVSPIKIGKTDHPKTRLATIRTSCPNKIDIASIFRTDAPECASIIERDVHNWYAARRLSGEWFDVEPYVAVAAVTQLFEKLAILRASQDNAANGSLASVLHDMNVFGVFAAREKLSAARYVRAWEQQ